MSVEGRQRLLRLSSEASQRLRFWCFSPCFRAVLVSFEAIVGENRDFLGPKQRAKRWRFWDVLPGFCLLGDKKVLFGSRVMTTRDKNLLLITSIFGCRCVISVMCHECQEGIPI